MDWRKATVVTGLSVLALALGPGYFRAQEIVSTEFDAPTAIKPAACAPSFGNPLAELCKQITDVDSDAFHMALLK
jgi:hypothetical protein